jgi:hypothetical protein
MNTFAAPIFNAITYFGMIVITCIVTLLTARTLSQGNKKRFLQVLLGMACLMVLTAIVAILGIFAKIDAAPPLFQVFTATVITLFFALGMSRFGGDVATNTSFGNLVILQAFRLPLEVVMYTAAVNAIMPVEFSFAGYNFDIVTGAAAILLGVALLRNKPVPRWALVAWNVWGIACLIVIVALAIATSPKVAAFGTDISKINTWVLFFPYAWLPTVLVSIAVLGHTLVSRKLWATRAVKRIDLSLLKVDIYR